MSNLKIMLSFKGGTYMQCGNVRGYLTTLSLLKTS